MLHVIFPCRCWSCLLSWQASGNGAFSLNNFYPWAFGRAQGLEIEEKIPAHTSTEDLSDFRNEAIKWISRLFSAAAGYICLLHSSSVARTDAHGSSLWAQGRTISAARYAGDMAQPNLNRLHESHTVPRPNWFFHPSVAPVARHSGNWAKSRSSGVRRRRSWFSTERGEADCKRHHACV